MTTNSRRWSGEEGIALFYALLVVLVVGGVVAVTIANALAETRQSAFELDYEDTVHVAETGAEVVLQELAANSAFVTTTAGGAEVDGPAAGQTSHDWAIAQATAKDASGEYLLPAVDTGEGESVAIRPSGTDGNFVYGIGFTPSRDAFVDGEGEPYVRVVRMQIAFDASTFEGEFAVLVGGNMNISSNAYAITGSNGSLHANGRIDISKDNVEGVISFSGDCTGGQCPEDNASVQGPVSDMTIPDIYARDVWDTDEARTIAAAGDWLDYCDGTGERSTADLPGGTGWYERDVNDTAPCTGTKTTPPSGVGGTSLNNVDDPGKVFYFDSTSAIDVKKVGGLATVIAIGDINQGPSANSPAMQARYPGLVLMTEGNLDVGGNAETADGTAAIAYARGNLTLRGTANSDGISYVARDSADIESQYLGGGNGEVRYDGGAQTDLGGDGTPLVLNWTEVSG